MKSKQFGMLIYHCLLMKKIYQTLLHRDKWYISGGSCHSEEMVTLENIKNFTNNKVLWQERTDTLKMSTYKQIS